MTQKSPQVRPGPEWGLTPAYMSGFGNGFETEALPGALPIGRNSPQKCGSEIAKHRVRRSSYD